jgi:hypothetical protein
MKIRKHFDGHISKIIKRNSNSWENLFKDIKYLVEDARSRTIKTINHIQLMTFFRIGEKIIEHEQAGNIRAEYGKNILNKVSKKLTIEFGRGFSLTNLKNMRQFYI